MRYSSIRAFVATGVLAVGLAVFVTAQTPQQPPPPEKPQDPAQQPPPPKFRVESNFVRVDAYPLKNGKPVFDLKAEEFEIFEDGNSRRSRPSSTSSFGQRDRRASAPR